MKIYFIDMMANDKLLFERDPAYGNEGIVIPRIGEHVTYKKIQYKVTEVSHVYDDRLCIRIVLRELNYVHPSNDHCP